MSLRALTHAAVCIGLASAVGCSSAEQAVSPAPGSPPAPSTGTGPVEVSVLFRPATAGDRLPPLAAEAVTRADARHATGPDRIDVTSARLASSVDALPAWVLGRPPTETCLLAARRGTGHAGVAYALACLPTAEVGSGRLMDAYFLPLRPRDALIRGVLPDDARNPALEAAGARRPVRVHGNVYSVVAHEPEALLFHRGRHEYRAPIPLPPGSQGGGLGQPPL